MRNPELSASVSAPQVHNRCGFFARYWHYFAIIVFTVLYHYPLVQPDYGMPPYGDFYSYYSPLRIYAAQRLHQGEMPFLTQGMFGGYQIYSDPPFAFFYPVNLLFALIIPDPSTEAALDFYILISLLLLSASAVFLGRCLKFSRSASVVAAIVMCMNGFIQMHITHIGILQVISATYMAGGLLALFAWGGGRNWRLALAAGIFMGAGNLVGHPQTTMFAHYGLGICMLAVSIMHWQRTRDRMAPIRILGWSLLTVIVGLMLAAIELLPTAHLISVCSKISMTRAEAMGEAILPRHLPSMIFPGFYLPLHWNFSLPVYTAKWPQWMVPNPLEGLTFLGVTALGLGLAGWLANFRRWPVQMLFWGSVYLVGASLGDHAPFYGIMYDYLPMVDVVRVPSRVLWLFYTAWALLVGLGLENLYSNRSNFRPQAFCYAAIILILVFAGMAAWVFLSYKNNWLDTLIDVLVVFHDDYDSAIRENLHGFWGPLKTQAIIGGFFVGCTLVWLIIAGLRGGKAFMVFAVTALIGFELFVYGFGRSYSIEVETYDRVDCPTMDVLPDHPAGRSIVPHFVHGGGAINVAAYNGKPLANGYSPTVPKWVLYTQPLDVPPWRYGVEDKYFDLWNVTDIALRRRPANARLGTYTVSIDDWGWYEIGAPWEPNSSETSNSVRSLMPTRMVMDLDEVTTPVSNLIVLCNSGRCIGWPDGTEVARMDVYARGASQPVASQEFRLGKELADGMYDQEKARGLKPAHGRPEISFERDALWEWSDDMDMYMVKVDLPTSMPIEKLVFEATGPFSTTFGVSQVGLTHPDGHVSIEYPLFIGDFREVETDSNKNRLLQRQSHPGYAWMVPSAERSSYKQIGYVMARLYDDSFDLKREVIVDKREYKDEDTARLDAAAPADFKGSATITWKRPEELIVHTQSNDKGWLVLSMSWDKGWTATVDGEPVTVSQANGPHCTVPLTAGEHEVHLVYTPVNYWAGVAVSAATLLFCLTGLLWPRRRYYHTQPQ